MKHFILIFTQLHFEKKKIHLVKTDQGKTTSYFKVHYRINHKTLGQTQRTRRQVCLSKMDPLACCRNYRIVDTSCEECPPGSFGIDCLDKCPPQFYGRFCREKCSCDPCDKITGCLKVTTMNTTRVSKEDGLCVNVSNGEALECCPNYRYAGCSCDVNDQMRNCSDNTIQESYHLVKTLTMSSAGFAVFLFSCLAIICILRKRKKSTKAVIQNQHLHWI
nr:protein draper-like [Crassostrea gigas]